MKRQFEVPKKNREQKERERREREEIAYTKFHYTPTTESGENLRFNFEKAEKYNLNLEIPEKAEEYYQDSLNRYIKSVNTDKTALDKNIIESDKKPKYDFA